MAMEEGELGAFRAFAESYPDDCLLLVDTIDTLESGVPNAITVFEELRAKGHEPVGIRLDSGDLAYLAIQAAALLDAAGFPMHDLGNDVSVEAFMSKAREVGADIVERADHAVGAGVPTVFSPWINRIAI